MASRKQLDEQVRALSGLRDQPLDAAAHERIAAGLGSRSSAVVAAAAGLLVHEPARNHVPLLIEAFERFMQRPVDTDKGCLAKTAVARALHAVEADCDALFLRAVTHVQLEPIWGGRQDTAVELRGVAAAALVQNDHPDVMDVLSRLLADPEPMARVGAASALGITRHVDAALPLLRFKVLAGDDDPRVLAACLASLLGSAPERSLPFVAELLQSRDAARRETAAIALGESRLPGAFEPLVAASQRVVLAEERRALWLGIALLRSEAGQAYLLERVAKEPEPLAELALEALAVFRHEDALRERALAAATARSKKLAAHARALLEIS